MVEPKRNIIKSTLILLFVNRDEFMCYVEGWLTYTSHVIAEHSWHIGTRIKSNALSIRKLERKMKQTIIDNFVHLLNGPENEIAYFQTERITVDKHIRPFM